MSDTMLKVENLTVSLTSNGVHNFAIDGLSFAIAKGQTFALVGESGCGKSMTAHSIARLLPQNAHLYQDAVIELDDYPLLSYSEKQMRRIRSHQIGMIFQDPMAALNPVMTIEAQLQEACVKHKGLEKSFIEQKLLDALEQVLIADPKRILKAYPHQLSGGMKQRVMIAMNLAKEPDLLIADEPTTALDVTTQAQVLALMKNLQAKIKMTTLLITHDLGVVAQMADMVGVMYGGHIVELASAQDFFQGPKHPYSQKLLAALPEHHDKGKQLSVIEGRVPQWHQPEPKCRFVDRCHNKTPLCSTETARVFDLIDYGQVRCHGYDPTLKGKDKPVIALPVEGQHQEAYVSEDKQPLLTVDDLYVHFPIRKGLIKRTVGYVKAVDGVSLSLSPGETLALVGESGCGKTTTGKALLNLLDAKGRVVYWGKNILGMKERLIRKVRGDLQFIFQDPFSSMNPKMRVGQIIEEGMIALKVGNDKQERMERIDCLLEQVGLSPDVKLRYPHEFSGGQRQRISIARALAVNPKVIVCDEPTSALDVSVQAQILNLLESLKLEYEISYVFITHDMGVVRYLADRIAVMYLGKIVETGSAQQLLDQPKHPYTQALLQCVPSANPSQPLGEGLTGEVPSPSNPPSGCAFHPRCPHAMPVCQMNFPERVDVAPNHQTYCYLYYESFDSAGEENGGARNHRSH